LLRDVNELPPAEQRTVLERTLRDRLNEQDSLHDYLLIGLHYHPAND
jgi:hypothetical protein